MIAKLILIDSDGPEQQDWIPLISLFGADWTSPINPRLVD